MVDLSPCVKLTVVGDLMPDTDWTPAVKGMDVIVRAAARMYVMIDSIADPLAKFRRVNISGTLKLARQAGRCWSETFDFNLFYQN